MHETLARLFSDTADAIRAKTGGTAQIVADEFPEAIAGIETGATPPEQSLTLNFNNAKIEQFISQVDYTSDYSDSSVASYTSGSDSGNPSGVNATLNAGTLNVYDNGGKCSKAVSAGTNAIYNIAPGHTAAFDVVSGGDTLDSGKVAASGNLRVIKLDGTINMRDLGGWTCDGGTVRYGLLFRSKELTGDNANWSQADQDLMENLIGIKAELDLRESTERGGEKSYGNGVAYLWQPIGNYADAFSDSGNRAKFKAAFEFIAGYVLHGKAVNYHCVAGADRTGTMSWIILTLLGVSQSDADKEYEITCFSGTDRKRNVSGRLGAVYARVAAKDGDTLQDKVAALLNECGISYALINQFRHAMIDGEPIDIEEPLEDPAYHEVNDLAAAPRMSYNRGTTSTATNFPGADNGGIALCVATPNGYPFTDRSSNTHYLMPIPEGCDHVKVSTTDASIIGWSYQAVKVSGTEITERADQRFSESTECSWAGEYDFMAITAWYSEDGSVRPEWSYDTSQISVKFFNEAGRRGQVKSVTPNASGMTVKANTGRILTEVDVAGDADLIAANIKNGVNIFGVVGTYAGSSPSGTKDITANGSYDVADFATANVNVPNPFHTGTVTPSAATKVLDIDLGFTGCTRFVIFANAVPTVTNRTDSMCWNGATGFAVWSRYRGTYNGSYVNSDGTVTINGTTAHIETSQDNAKFDAITYTWVAW